MTQSKAKTNEPAKAVGKSKARKLRITDADAGQRIDNFLRRALRGVPKSRIYSMLRRGEVRVAGARVRPDYRIAVGDELRLPPVRSVSGGRPPRPSQRLADHLSGAIVHEDDALMALNKPAGLAVHGGSGVGAGLIESLRALRSDLTFLELVHRLDRDTSGCILLAKRRSALRRLHAALRAGHFDKRYLALVEGDWLEARHEIRAPLRRVNASSGERFVRVAADGRAALTRVRIQRRLARGTLLELEPVTGRTHQLRVHLAHTGAAIVGDRKYASKAKLDAQRRVGIRRLCLHAWRLAVPSGDSAPGGEELAFEAPLPADFHAALEAFDQDASASG